MEHRRERTASLYSQWDLSQAAEESSDEEDDAFLTPSEGLSEVEEEDEEEEEEKPEGAVVVDPLLTKNNVKKGARADTSDVLGTGPSIVHRTRPLVSETKVRKRTLAKMKHPDPKEQSAALANDIDICREVLRLFLTSHMKEAEDLCFEKDPEGNRLYLISAQGIINALKVGFSICTCTSSMLTHRV